MNGTACFTGHRFLPSGKKDEISALLDAALAEAYADHYRTFLCGGALGFDTLAALRTLALRERFPDVELVMAVPCRNQPVRWPARDRETYHIILDQADRVEILSPEYYKGCMQMRNRYMVDHSSLCICYLEALSGGTAGTVRYAAYRGLEIRNLAMPDLQSDPVMKERICRFIYTSRSAVKSAATVPSSPFRAGKTKRKNTSD